MKRSKAIEIISNFIYELNVEPDESAQKADAILSALEKVGMQPPLNGYNYDTRWGDRGFFDSSIPCYEWEKE